MNHFKENLAPMHLSKVTANSARALFSKWPLLQSKKSWNERFPPHDEL